MCGYAGEGPCPCQVHEKSFIFHPDPGREYLNTVDFTGDGDSVRALSASLLV